jgi:predicted permease
VVRGREFSDQDGPDSMPAAMVSETFARRYWPGQEALGRRLKLDRRDGWITLVGVVADVQYHWITRTPPPVLYLPYRQEPQLSSAIALRTTGNPMSFAPAVRARLAAIDPNQPVYYVMTLRQLIAASTVGLAYLATMMGALGAGALVLCALGLYGVVAYSVSERQQEIGVRVALGAGPRQILSMVLRQGGRLAALGLVIGLPLSFGLARLLASLLFGASAAEPLSFAAAAVVLIGVALLASYVPARHALRVCPSEALRGE